MLSETGDTSSANGLAASPRAWEPLLVESSCRWSAHRLDGVVAQNMGMRNFRRGTSDQAA
jgi:hypothetical protein